MGRYASFIFFVDFCWACHHGVGVIVVLSCTENERDYQEITERRCLMCILLHQMLFHRLLLSPTEATADYVSNNCSLPMAHPIQKLLFNVSQPNRPRGLRSASGNVTYFIVGDFTHTLIVLQAMFGIH